jgi:bifunctional UDP-N-acetylglucosamine pyrophosphorylase/glucosamine-1-phosphate N-acetyltransferase
VQAAEDALRDFDGDLIVLYGDTPLIPDTAIKALFEEIEGGAQLGVLGFEAANPGAYGRLVTDRAGNLDAIVEAKEASPEQLAITLCNSGVMAGNSKRMFELLSQVTNDNAKGEYYLTDIVAIAREGGGKCRVVTCSEADVQGVNSRMELANAEGAFQQARRQELLQSGVTMTAPETVFFSYDTLVEPDVLIEPNVVFGPSVRVETGARIRAFSHLEGAVVKQNAEIGPYARLRPGADIGVGAKANHLAYLGDGDIGKGANIGAGTIFCNYDGFLKYQTTIGEGAFIGSNSSLVAPVTIGAGALVGSGSVVTKDVGANSLAVTRGRQIEKKNWADTFREQKSREKASKS